MDYIEMYLKSVGLSKFDYVEVDNDHAIDLGKLLSDYDEFKVKELKEKAGSGDKITSIDTQDTADCSKPMIGLVPCHPESNFISESPSQTPIGSMEGDQNVKVCGAECATNEGFCPHAHNDRIRCPGF